MNPGQYSQRRQLIFQAYRLLTTWLSYHIQTQLKVPWVKSTEYITPATENIYVGQNNLAFA